MPANGAVIFAKFEQRVRAFERRAGHVRRAARLVERLRQDEVGRLFLRLHEARKLHLRDLHIRLEFLRVGEQLGHFEFAEQLPGLHGVAAVHGDIGEVARDLRIERRLLVRLQRARQRDPAMDVPALRARKFHRHRIRRVRGDGDAKDGARERFHGVWTWSWLIA